MIKFILWLIALFILIWVFMNVETIGAKGIKQTWNDSDQKAVFTQLWAGPETNSVTD